MYESPQTRRLHSDLAAMERLREESSILTFRVFGKPATRYVIEYHGRSLAREGGKIRYRDRHEIEVRLGASYPRTMPELRWISPIYHPNVSEVGLVCLGAYGTHWSPSLKLDELCNMLWDMARYHNYDVRSPYNRDAALWVASQTTYQFPLDPRPLRDKRVARGRIELEPKPVKALAPPPPAAPDTAAELQERPAAGEPDVVLDREVDLRRTEPQPQPPEQEVVFLN